jgi:hypothetical protein
VPPQVALRTYWTMFWPSKELALWAPIAPETRTAFGIWSACADIHKRLRFGSVLLLPSVDLIICWIGHVFLHSICWNERKWLRGKFVTRRRSDLSVKFELETGFHNQRNGWRCINRSLRFCSFGSARQFAHVLSFSIRLFTLSCCPPTQSADYQPFFEEMTSQRCNYSM